MSALNHQTSFSIPEINQCFQPIIQSVQMFYPIQSLELLFSEITMINFSANLNVFSKP